MELFVRGSVIVTSPCGIGLPLPDMEYLEPSNKGVLSGSSLYRDHSQYLQKSQVSGSVCCDERILTEGILGSRIRREALSRTARGNSDAMLRIRPDEGQPGSFETQHRIRAGLTLKWISKV